MINKVNHNRTREYWADYAKAIAIWLMVFAHVGISSSVQTFIHVFHMPLFFFVSGYFDKGNNGILVTVRKNWFALMQPYFFFSFFALTYAWLYPFRHPELYPGIITVADYFKTALLGIIRMEDKVLPGSFLPNLALWFLPCLFLVKLIFCLLNKIKEWLVLKDWVWILFALCFMCTYPLLIPVNWFSIDSAFMAIPIYIAGYITRKYQLIDYIVSYKVLLVILCFLYTLFIAPMNDMVNMDGGYAGKSLPLFYINALIGIIMVIALVSFAIFKRKSILSLIGENTLVVLGLHTLFILAYKFVAYYIYGFINDCIAFAISALVILSIIPCVKFINKYISFVIGKVK